MALEYHTITHFSVLVNPAQAPLTDGSMGRHIESLRHQFEYAATSPMYIMLIPVHNLISMLWVHRKDMTLKEAEVLALATLKQVMEEKVRILPSSLSFDLSGS